LAAHPEIKRRKAHANMIFVFMDKPHVPYN